MSDTFMIDNNRQRVDAELAAQRALYDWYNKYLSPMATFRNTKLGDGMPAAAVAASVTAAQPSSAVVPAFGAALLSPEQHAVVNAAIQSNPEATADAVWSQLEQHPLFKEVEQDVKDVEKGVQSLESFVSGKAMGLREQASAQTGVPLQDVPTVIYLGLRATFNKLTAVAREKILAENKPLQNPADYKALYDRFLKLSNFIFGEKVIDWKEVSDHYNTDVMLGWQRLAGVNPRVMQALTPTRLTELQKKMALTDQHVQLVAGPKATIASEVARNRLYVCDYALLDGMRIQKGRFLSPAISIFWSDAENCQLLPVAIQLSQTKGVIRTPADKADWPATALQFRIADFNYHEMGTHLSEAHFCQEAFAVSARRNFTNSHPIGGLLNQVYYALLFNNALGRLQLVNTDPEPDKMGFANRMMAGEIQSSVDLVKNFFIQVWHWDDWSLDTFLRKQGTDDRSALPVYPYRDDGLPLWDGIRLYANAYVNAWYAKDTDVAEDIQLKGWVEELIDPAKGNLAAKGFPNKVVTKAALSEVLARLVWQASAGHGAINYSQWQYFAVVPNAPGAGYDNGADVMEILPKLKETAYQLEIFNILTQKVFGRLGDYNGEDFSRRLNNAAEAAVNDFRKTLKNLTDDVKARNQIGPRVSFPYGFLNPTNLPNSTNI